MFSWFKPKSQKTLGEIAIDNIEIRKKKCIEARRKRALNAMKYVINEIENDIRKHHETSVTIDSYHIWRFKSDTDLYSEFLKYLDDQGLVIVDNRQTFTIKPKEQ